MFPRSQSRADLSRVSFSLWDPASHCCLCREQTLPDNMRLRGDINILLLGDPSTAKSQLLKFIEKVRRPPDPTRACKAPCAKRARLIHCGVLAPDRRRRWGCTLQARAAARRVSRPRSSGGRSW
jgi:hypothetical protein